MGKLIITEDEKTQILELYYLKTNLMEVSSHTENLYKSWANKKSNNPELALSLMDDFFNLQQQLPKKDFTLYKTAEELKTDIDKLKTFSKKPEEDVDVIYKDNKLLVIATKTWEAGCKYGYGTKWCTSSKKDSSYWFRHNSTGTEFIWIIKDLPQGNPLHKVSLHIKENMSYDWCTSVNNCSSVDPYKRGNINIPNFEEIFNKCVEYNNKRLEIKKKDREENRKKIMSSPIYIKSVEFLKHKLRDIQNDYDLFNEIVDKTYLSIRNIANDYFLSQISNDDIIEIKYLVEDTIKSFIENEEIINNIEDDITKFILDKIFEKPNSNFNTIKNEIKLQIIEIIVEHNYLGIYYEIINKFPEYFEDD